ncbi:MAG: hypothetical protein LBG77_02835, partial [Dysgonamonadaceae bacterium]|nr:hypothetical protein [Dysgonamonadaceae bacterium]
ERQNYTPHPQALSNRRGENPAFQAVRACALPTTANRASLVCGREPDKSLGGKNAEYIPKQWQVRSRPALRIFANMAANIRSCRREYSVSWKRILGFSEANTRIFGNEYSGLYTLRGMVLCNVCER